MIPAESAPPPLVGLEIPLCVAHFFPSGRAFLVVFKATLRPREERRDEERDPRGASNRGRRRARTCISHLRARPQGTVDLPDSVSAKAFTPERRAQKEGTRGKERRDAR